jgi:hypothetical protein
MATVEDIRRFQLHLVESGTGSALRWRDAAACFTAGRKGRGNRPPQSSFGLWGKSQPGATMVGKRVQFDNETWQAIDLLARDSMKDFQELADEAFRDLLTKHDRPTDLKSALRQSAGQKGMGPGDGAQALRQARSRPKT